MDLSKLPKAAFVALVVAFAVAPALVPAPEATMASQPVLAHLPVSTRKPEAQQAFDRGMTLIYAFAHQEAEKSFKQAARLDPQLAMAHWGVSLANSSYINRPPTAEQEKAAYRAIRKAQTLAGYASEKEQAYIAALARRHSAGANPDYDRLAVDYSQAMAGLSRRYPEDLDAAVLYAESLMVLRPWQYWRKDGTPAPDTEKLVAVLEAVLAREPEHLGANHHYIHAVEASKTPGRALPSAERLARLPMDSAADHLVHMPAHTYLRVGDYERADTSNVHSIDHALTAHKLQDPKYNKDAACSHCLEFLIYSYGMQGRLADARAAAVKQSKLYGEDAWASLPVLVRFGRWDELLVLPPPKVSESGKDRWWYYASGLRHYGRGLAQVAKGQLPQAEAELKAIALDSSRSYKEPAPPTDPNRLRVATSTGDAFRSSYAKSLRLAQEILRARIAAARGNQPAALFYWERAVALQDSLDYSEPPFWYYPVRESLGGALLSSGAYAGAEAVFRTDLAENARNPRSLFGLAESLDAQGKSGEAEAVRREFETAWQKADISLLAKDL
ncbi:tetratricopeptide repeat protein [Gloeobacter violaceus]|uniref:Gll2361 protein n=1 Tax=Gloeobacter violaceus (strain ATCC 29082 / PCC 7421) TaxID=251221 RepID=Q7NI23_GLOVI|nr:tetratricopeptide repeat protein [Gloeobacter violaceus]BAC90302.1 gll2361 [Gloeobacter violaceus PCC 7421]